MIYEFHAEFKNRLSMNASCKDINSLLNGMDLSVPSSIQLLSQFLAATRKETKNCAQTGDRPDRSAGLRKLIDDKKLDKYYEEQLENFLKPLSIMPYCPNLAIFPSGSFALHFSFSLRKPYISRDDTDFYIIDNPVKKEWVFKVPYIAPSQWKGALRSAMVRELVNDNLSPEDFAKRRFRMAVLFGDEQGEEPGAIKGLSEYLDERGGQEAAEKSRQLVRRYFRGEIDEPLSHHKGILHFYPTYFDRIGLEVINPHDRETGAGKQPIYFECVPAGNESKGTFTLLYVPLVGPDMSDEDAKNQAKGDFEAVASGIKAMMTIYGFGAKTSSGFGIGEVQIDNAKVEPSEMMRVWLEEVRNENK